MITNANGPYDCTSDGSAAAVPTVVIPGLAQLQQQPSVKPKQCAQVDCAILVSSSVSADMAADILKTIREQQFREQGLDLSYAAWRPSRIFTACRRHSDECHHVETSTVSLAQETVVGPLRRPPPAPPPQPPASPRPRPPRLPRKPVAHAQVSSGAAAGAAATGRVVGFGGVAGGRVGGFWGLPGLARSRGFLFSLAALLLVSRGGAGGASLWR